MAYLFADENFPQPTLRRLHELGHTVLTLQESGQASLALSDTAVLALAKDNGCALLTLNRRHFIRLHELNPKHHGIVVYTFDPNFDALAERIDAAVTATGSLDGQLIRIVRPG